MIVQGLSPTGAPIILVGATGTGKSAAAMELARACTTGAAILCMDAMQVYRGAEIGTSKPTAAERAEVPHGGLDLGVLGSSFDVAQYLKHAATFLREQNEAGRRVIIVGGTGLYFRALTRGLCEAPQGSDELRAELSSLSVPELRERLGKIDPAMLERLDASNPRRLVRAIEVKESTGRSLRDWQEETPEPLVSDFTALWIQREKAELEKRIEARVEAMFSQGWVEEVRGLVERYGAEAVRNFPGIGYGEIAAAMELRGRLEGTVAGPATATLPKLKRDIIVATRQYAKRQLTWFARELNLQAVMLTGNQLISAALPALL
jgi:tRNA dimethylallyltransferase